ncbi:hypothetical protein J6590_103747 [Homalodisca vitripennis]|nr:hypothetical protein J6590_059140 [Homalodisca vitripennis]KAG8279506.1 hypothetical protein J6590_103747 [Homalodisca vitripennis]
MSQLQDIDNTVNHPQYVHPAKKRNASFFLSDSTRRSPSLASSLILAAEMNRKPPNQPRILPLYIDPIPDCHTYAAALYRLTIGDFTARCSKGGFIVITSRIPNFLTFQAYLTERNVSFFTRSFFKFLLFAAAEEVQDALSFSVSDVFQLLTLGEKTHPSVVCFHCNSERDCDNTRLFYVPVAVHPYRKPPGPVQWHRCQ